MCKSSSLSRCLMMSCDVSHRCLTIVMQRMCCQRSTLRVGNSCCIMLYPCSDGAPQRCQWMPLCSVALSPHVLSLAKYLSQWRMRRFTKSQSHLITTNPGTAVCAWRIENHQTTFLPVCSFTHSASDHPSTPPVPTGRLWAPGLLCPQHPRWRPRRGAAPGWRCGRRQPRGAVVSNLRRRRETSTAGGAGGLHPVALHRPPPTAVGETAICRVISFKIV